METLDHCSERQYFGAAIHCQYLRHEALILNKGFRSCYPRTVYKILLYQNLSIARTIFCQKTFDE